MKSFAIDVRDLFKPLTFTFGGYKGDFSVFFSMKKKEKRPSEDSGYSERADNTSVVIYPTKMKDILPGTIRFPKDKPLYMSIETSQPCVVLIDIKQNYKNGKIPKKSMKERLGRPSFRGREEGEEKDSMHH